MAPRSNLRPALALRLAPIVAALVVVTIASACAIRDGGHAPAAASGSTSTGAGGAGGAGGALPVGQTAREYFEQEAEPALLDACGGCHEAGGSSEAPFLAGPDVYATISSWPGIIVAVPDQSILVTHPAGKDHAGGNAPNLPDDLKPKVLVWLAMEAADLPTPDAGTYIPPFKPLLQGAFNTVYLDPLSPDLKYASVSFNAQELGTPPSILRLTNLEVHPVEGTTIHIVHPLFTVYPTDGSTLPDSVDSFSNVDESFTIDSAPTLATGELLLTNWSKDARIGLAFETIEVTTAGGGDIHCKNVASFKSNAVPAMQYCAATCHGGNKAEAQAAMDLSKLNDADPSVACDQVHNRIAPSDPPSSQIFQVTDPSKQVVHMFKFMGNVNDYNAFKTAVTPWIVAEQ